LRKKDDSLWQLNAPDYGSGRPPSGFPSLEFKRLGSPKDVVAFGAGRGGIGVALTRGGEVWTWGRVFGERSLQDRLARFYEETMAGFGVKVGWRQPTAITRQQPWQLRNVGPETESAR
jgi:hypothetical protein